MISVEELIHAPKEIVNKKRPEFKLDQRHFRADLSLKCDTPPLNMTMFLRRLKDFPEDFSVGIRINTPNPYSESVIVLVRYQGPHGGQSETRSMEDIHNRYHIHCYSQDDFNHNRKKASLNNKMEAKFNSFEEAICELLEYCNIKDPNGIFDQEKNTVKQLRFL